MVDPGHFEVFFGEKNNATYEYLALCYLWNVYNHNITHKYRSTVREKWRNLLLRRPSRGTVSGAPCDSLATGSAVNTVGRVSGFVHEGKPRPPAALICML